MKNLKIKGKRLLGYIVSFVLGFVGFHLIVNYACEKSFNPTYQILCINNEGDTVAIYETMESSLNIDTLPEDGWRKINYFTTVEGHHVALATQSGKIIIKEKKAWENN